MEASRTLADSLLDDLNDLSSDEEDENDDDDQNQQDNHREVDSMSPRNETGETTTGIDTKKESTNINGDQLQLDASTKDISKPSQEQRVKLLDDKKLKKHLKLVRELMEEETNHDRMSDADNTATTATTTSAFNGGTNGKTTTTAEEVMHRQYQLIQTSNKFLQSLQEELSEAHQILRNAYRNKFPELEDLVVDSVQYLKAVNIIGNETDLTNVNDALNNVLTPNQIITISVAGSTTSGRSLTSDEMDAVKDASEYMSNVLREMDVLTNFVSQRIQALAPNLCCLIGPTLAARLVGLAGGLSELSRIPACNLQVMGQTKYTSASRGGLFSTNFVDGGSKPHTGILHECEFVQSVPRHMQRNVLKLVASKVALAVRVDCVNAETGQTTNKLQVEQDLTSAGMQFREQITSKIRKMAEPHSNEVGIKALPKPDLESKKRRGGKRMRRLKENYEETELMKQANKRMFSQGIGEYGDDAMGLTMGMLDTNEGGTDLRKKSSQLKKLRQSNTKASRKRAAQLAAQSKNHASMMASGLHSVAGASVMPGHATSLRTTSTSGTASSMVFTPVQGMELVDPSAQADRVKKANAKWFTENAGFQSALPNK